VIALDGLIVTTEDPFPLVMNVEGLHEYVFAPVAFSVAVDPEHIPKSMMLEEIATLGAGWTFMTSVSEVVPQAFVTANVTFWAPTALYVTAGGVEVVAVAGVPFVNVHK